MITFGDIHPKTQKIANFAIFTLQGVMLSADFLAKLIWFVQVSQDVINVSNLVQMRHVQMFRYPSTKTTCWIFKSLRGLKGTYMLCCTQSLAEIHCRLPLSGGYENCQI